MANGVPVSTLKADVAIKIIIKMLFGIKKCQSASKFFFKIIIILTK